MTEELLHTVLGESNDFAYMDWPEYDESKTIANEITLPIQKWNNIVFNYKSNQVDLFFQGAKVRTGNSASKTIILESSKCNDN